jgi:hypothetical protein
MKPDATTGVRKREVPGDSKQDARTRAMLRDYKTVALGFLTVAVLASPVIFGWVTPRTPPAPSAWHQVHVGMQRSNILQLVGPAQTGMYPEKSVETWYRDGELGIRRLEVWYQNYGDDRATMVREYIFWRPCRRCIFTRTEK